MFLFWVVIFIASPFFRNFYLFICSTMDKSSVIEAANEPLGPEVSASSKRSNSTTTLPPSQRSGYVCKIYLCTLGLIGSLALYSKVCRCYRGVVLVKGVQYEYVKYFWWNLNFLSQYVNENCTGYLIINNEHSLKIHIELKSHYVQNVTNPLNNITMTCHLTCQSKVNYR
jgi:hypothetical protein